MTDYLRIECRDHWHDLQKSSVGASPPRRPGTDDDFRSRLLEVALDYDHQAEKLESEFASQH